MEVGATALVVRCALDVVIAMAEAGRAPSPSYPSEVLVEVLVHVVKVALMQLLQ